MDNFIFSLEGISELTQRLKHMQSRVAVIKALAERIDKEAGSGPFGVAQARIHAWDIADIADQLRKDLGKINKELSSGIG